MNTAMKSKRKKSKKKIENNIEKATQSATTLSNKESNFSEVLFRFLQIIFVVLEIVLLVGIIVITVKNLCTDDYYSPYFLETLKYSSYATGNDCSMVYSFGVLALKFIIWIKSFII